MRKMSTVRAIWKVTKDTFRRFFEDKCLKLSAALAYYTVFSLPPMLLVIISIGGIFYGEEAIQGEVFDIMSGYIGADPAAQVEDVLANISFERNNRIATIIGAAILLFGATGIFGQIQDSINFIWGLKTKPKKSWVALIVNRLISFSMVVVLGFLLLVSLTINTFLEVFFTSLEQQFSNSVMYVIYFIDYIIIFAVIIGLFALIFKILPDAVLKWKHIMAGALVTGTLFMAGKSVISMYVTDTYLVSAYGGTASLIVLLLWVYYSAIILYLGAEFTQAYVRHQGLRIQPNRYAVFVDQVEVETEEPKE